MPRRLKQLFQVRKPRTIPHDRHRVRPLLEALEDRLVPAAHLTIMDAPTGIFPQFSFVDPNPDAGGRFGTHVVPLSTGNVVVTDPSDDAGGANAGAVYLFNGLTGALISTLTGSNAGDGVGSGGVIALASNGNFVVRSPNWDNVAAGAVDAGAVTWGSGTTGISGSVSNGNSIVGSTAGDMTGGSVTALTNGNFVVASRLWDNLAAAAANAGAATWGNGTTGQSHTGFGAISDLNSIVGTTADDQVSNTGVIALSNGQFVVGSSIWDDTGVLNAGAVTWGNGTNGRNALGVFGGVSALNSIVGSTSNDQVSSASVTALPINGNFVIRSPTWQSGGAAVGAVTWGNGTTGGSASGFGAVTAANSIVGSTVTDMLNGSVMALTNGNFVVRSHLWDNVAASAVDAGAATWGDGATGMSATGFGAISAANSIVGATADDQVSETGVTALTNGNFVVASRLWNRPGVALAGAATWGNGLTGASATGFGAVSIDNSIVGSTGNDQVTRTNIAGAGVTPLTNGNFVVASFFWTSGGATQAGAATWGNGTTGKDALGNFGAVSTANSIVGATTSDSVGSAGVAALTNGNFVVRSPSWDNVAAAVANAGAATWGNGTTGRNALGDFGAISDLNSIVGTTTNDLVSSSGLATLTNGNFVVGSQSWGNAVGAATWGDGATGQSATGFGAVSAANSIVGSTTGDSVTQQGLTALSDGNFVVRTMRWDNGTAADAGAVTWGDGTNGQTLTGFGTLNAENSIIGSTANATLGTVVEDPANEAFLAAFSTDNDRGRVVSGFPDPNLLTFARGSSIATPTFVTPAFVALTLNQGTAVTMQATNALNVGSPLTVNNPSGNGGNLTLQSQNTLGLDAAINTDNGNLNLQAPTIGVSSAQTLTVGSGTATFQQGHLLLGEIGTTTLTVTGKLAFTSTLSYDPGIDGTTPGSGYDQIIATDGVALGDANLDLNVGFTPNVGQSFTLIDNQSGNAVNGTFAGLPEKALLNIQGTIFQISYKGGTGNDVVLTRIATPGDLVVDNTGDVNDGDFSAGQQTLREAIELANVLPDANTISFDPTVFGTPQTIVLGSELAALSADVTITGPGANLLTIDAGMSRHVTVLSGVTAQLSGLALVNGAGPMGGGSILNLGDLTLTDCTFRDNSSGFGGAIYNSGTLKVLQSTFSGNTASDGGALFNEAIATVTNSTFSGNSAGDDGGGIFSATSGTLTISNSTFSRNQAAGHGGGIDSRGTLTARNVTVTGNRADSDNDSDGLGGGIYKGSTSVATLHNTLVAGNFAGMGNTANDLGILVMTGDPFTGSSNLIGDADSAGGLTDDDEGNIVGVNGVGTRDIDTILSTALAFNGGTTQTHALVTSSPALNAGDNTQALGVDGSTALTFDQRGNPFARVSPGGGTVDIGAFEAQAAPIALLVSNQRDESDGDYAGLDLSLREAIEIANGSMGPDIITFRPGLTGLGDATLFLSLFDTGLDDGEVGPTALLITSEITITGPVGGNGIRIVRGDEVPEFRLFHIAGTGNLTVENVTLSGGIARGGEGGYGRGTGGGGGGAAGMGGAFFNQGLLTIRNSTLLGNVAAGGGGEAVGSVSDGDGAGGGGGLGAEGETPTAGAGGAGGGPNGGNGATSTPASGGGLGGGGGGGGRNGVLPVQAGAAGGFGGGGGGSSGNPNPMPGGLGGFGGGGGGGSGHVGNGPSGGGQSLFGGGAGGTGGAPVNNGGGGGGGGAGLGAAVFNHQGAVTIINSTLTGNAAYGGNGEAGDNGGHGGSGGSAYGAAVFSFGGMVTINSSTIADNEVAGGFGASDGADGLADAGAIYIVVSGAHLAMNNTIVSGSTGSTVELVLDDEVTSSGFGNLVRSHTGFTGQVVSMADPMLGPLQDNGGPTSTHAINQNSPAFNMGDNAAAAGLANDQRGPGFARLQGGRVDIGAFESDVFLPAAPAAAAVQQRVYQTITNRNLRASRRRGLLREFGRAAGRRVKVQLVRGPEVGKLLLRKNGSFVFTPPPGFTGDVTFVVRRFDGAGLDEQVTVVLHVKPRPRVFAVVPGQTLEISAELGLLRDVRAFERGPVAVQLVQGPRRGQLELKSNGSFTFVAPAQFRGKASFRYQLVINGAPGAVGRVTLTTQPHPLAEQAGPSPA